MWTHEALFFNTQHYFLDICQAIDNAQQSIDVEMYIFENDKLGQRLLKHLAAAAKRGVKVRLLVDGIGSPIWREQVLPWLNTHQVDSRIYHPLPKIFSLESIGAIFKPHQVLRAFRRINKRNHKKVFILDNQYAFIGSMNISHQHRRWRETGIAVYGPEVDDLTRSFELIWCRAYSPYQPMPARQPIRQTVATMQSNLVKTNHTIGSRRENFRQMLAMINQAKERIWITNAYFVPNAQLIIALVRARHHGTDVRLLLPDKSDVRIVRWVSKLYYITLLQAGIHIYEYQPTMLHAKTLLIDNWGSIGTSNLNQRSLRHDLEVDIVTQAPNSLRDMALQFKVDIRSARQVTIEEVQNRPIWERIGGYLGKLFEYWL